MKPAAIEKARARLRNAKRAIADIEKCTDYHEFTDLWYTFLTSNKAIYTALNKGAKNNPQSRQWMGGKARQRKEDQLLQYLFQARDDDEHGLNQVTERKPGHLAIGKAAPGFSKSIHIKSLIIEDGKVSGEVESMDNKPVLIESTPPHPILATVHGRGNVSFVPPAEHLGHSLPDQSPLTVAKLAITYMESLIDEAETLS